MRQEDKKLLRTLREKAKRRAGTILLIVHPTNPGRFRAIADGFGMVVASSRQPSLDAARELLAQGVEPGTILVMRHAGSAVRRRNTVVRGISAMRASLLALSGLP